MGLFTYRTHFHKVLPNPSRTLRPNGQTKKVGSQTQGVAYSIGYPVTIIAWASIHLPLSQSLPHPLFGQFRFNLMNLHLERLGLKFLRLYRPSLSLFLTLCL